MYLDYIDENTAVLIMGIFTIFLMVIVMIFVSDFVSGFFAKVFGNKKFGKR